MIINTEKYELYKSRVPKGWIALVDNLTEKIHSLDTKVQIMQIKEKFGGLRYYIYFPDYEDSEENQHIYSLIDEAEKESHKICQECGSNDAKTSGRHWLRTLCTNCRQRYKK